jgi:beta-glucanase (GH16 family)
VVDTNWIKKFHIWRMDWDNVSIRLFLDDQLLNEVLLSETVNPDGFNPFLQPHFILLNLAIGANGGDPSKSAFPIKYEVDWVRVYQKN